MHLIILNKQFYQSLFVTVCKEYGKNVFISLGDWDFGGGDQKIDTCNQLETLIVGGRDARPREFPHMVSSRVNILKD